MEETRAAYPFSETEGVKNSLDALKLAMDWAEGRRSWTNFGPHAPYTPDVIAAMDAQEVVKWTAMATCLHALEVKGG